MMPTVCGILDRRILANYRIDAERMAKLLPKPFRPHCVQGYAIGGICLIRLKHLRPKYMPLPWGLGSESAAHRIAVEWEENGTTRQGVYIPRRDTNSRLITWTGGRLFPGWHHHAQFTVIECGDTYTVTMASDDGHTRIEVAGQRQQTLPKGSVFTSVDEASAFFEGSSWGYSPMRKPGCFDGMELRCQDWKVEALHINHVKSSYFENETQFPRGSVHFDCALVMRGIQHEWHLLKELQAA
jgi:hypothetical protein